MRSLGPSSERSYSWSLRTTRSRRTMGRLGHSPTITTTEVPYLRCLLNLCWTWRSSSTSALVIIMMHRTGRVPIQQQAGPFWPTTRSTRRVTLWLSRARHAINAVSWDWTHALRISMDERKQSSGVMTTSNVNITVPLVLSTWNFLTFRRSS